MRPMIQALESRVLFAATPTQAVLDATAQLAAAKAQLQTDLAAYHAGVASANAAFATARSTALAAIKQALGNSPLGGILGGIIDGALGAAKQALQDVVSTHKTALGSNIATWKAAHVADLQSIKTDTAALRAAIKASHAR